MQPPPHLHSKLLQILERSFADLAGADSVIDARELQHALGLRTEYLARRVLAVFDTDGDGVIQRDEFLEGVRKLVLGSTRDKLLSLSACTTMMPTALSTASTSCAWSAWLSPRTT
jgi:EF hand